MNFADRALDWFFDSFVPWIILACLLLCFVSIVALVFIGVKEASREKSPHIVLESDSWQCSRTETRTFTQMMLVGKVMVPQVITRTDCVEYQASR